jgi:hypothetical protein
MNGRLEHEIKVEAKIDKKLKNLPYIFTEYYYYLKSSKSINTIIRYIGYVEDFMDYITHGVRDNEFYKDVKVQAIRQYLSSLDKKVVDGKVVRMGPEMKATRWSAINTFFKFMFYLKMFYLTKVTHFFYIKGSFISYFIKMRSTHSPFECKTLIIYTPDAKFLASTYPFG